MWGWSRRYVCCYEYGTTVVSVITKNTKGHNALDIPDERIIARITVEEYAYNTIELLYGCTSTLIPTRTVLVY